MTKKYIMFLVVFTITFGFSSVLRADEKKDKLVDELYTKTGFKEQLHNLPEVFNLSLNEELASIDKPQGMLKDYYENIDRLLFKAFDVSTLDAEAKSHLNKNINVEDIGFLLHWLETPVGKKASKLEVRASRAENVKEFTKYIKNLQSNPIPEPRVKLLEELESHLNTLDLNVEMLMNIQLATAVAMIYSMSSDNHQEISDIQKKIEGTRLFLQAAIEPLIIGSLDFIYHDLNDDELRILIDFYKKEKAKNANKVFSDAFIKAVTKASYDFGQRSAEFIQNRLKQEKT